MRFFELKRFYNLTWADIPLVEAPTYAFSNTFRALNNPDNNWSRVINIREFAAAEFPGYSSLRHYSYAEERIRDLTSSGHYVILCRSGKPLSPVFHWQEDTNHPHNGIWVDSRNYFGMNTAIPHTLARITHEWHNRQTQSFMDDLMDSPYAIARAAVEEYVAIPRVINEITQAPAAALSIAPNTPEPIKNTDVATETGSEKPAYKVLKGKYGTLHDYGDYIVHWDVDNVIGRTDIMSKPAYKVRHCYALGEGYGLPITDNIAPGKPLLNFGNKIPHGTIFATFVPDGKGNLAYPNSRNGIRNSPHLFVYDANSGGLVETKGNYSVNVVEQWAGLSEVSQHTIQNNNSDKYRLYKHLEDYYAVTIKK